MALSWKFIKFQSFCSLDYNEWSDSKCVPKMHLLFKLKFSSNYPSTTVKIYTYICFIEQLVFSIICHSLYPRSQFFSHFISIHFTKLFHWVLPMRQCQNYLLASLFITRHLYKGWYMPSPFKLHNQHSIHIW